MSTLTSPPRLLDLPFAREREDQPCSDGGRLTLGDRVDSVWEGLRAVGAATCPLCGGRMERQATGKGHCRGCGSTMS
jgi:hypothetical protein